MKQSTPPSRSRPIPGPSPLGKNLSRWLPTAVVCLFLTATAALASPAPAPAPARWSGLADTLFTHHTDPATASGTAIAQDGTGFIWLATQSGLTRWDGYHFRHYSADPQTAGSLPDGFLLALYVDDR